MPPAFASPAAPALPDAVDAATDDADVDVRSLLTASLVDSAVPCDDATAVAASAAVLLVSDD